MLFYPFNFNRYVVIKYALSIIIMKSGLYIDKRVLCRYLYYIYYQTFSGVGEVSIYKMSESKLRPRKELEEVSNLIKMGKKTLNFII